MSSVLIKKLPNSVDAPSQDLSNRNRLLPLLAAIDSEEFITIAPKSRAVIPTGISLELPHNIEALVIPDSELAAQSGITVLNNPGTIDPDFRGEIMVILINLGSEDFSISRGTLIAHLNFKEFIRVELNEVSELSMSARGEGGLGSTGQN